MPLIRIFSNPVIVDLEHNGNTIGTYTDEWGTYDIYKIETVHWEEVNGGRWEVVVEHPTTGQPVSQVIGPFESGFKNLPTPIRFDSYPLEAHCLFRRT
ncbi:hypothetical protein ACFLXI_05200 [Chloroflexota bacterium]